MSSDDARQVVFSSKDFIASCVEPLVRYLDFPGLLLMEGAMNLFQAGHIQWGRVKKV